MPRAGLNRAGVIRAGLATVDDGGPRGFADLTLAAVAARTGVAVPSLYKHVGSLGDLRHEIAVASVRQLTDVLRTAAVGRSGGDALRALADAYRAYAHEHPGRYSATQIAPRRADESARGAGEAGEQQNDRDGGLAAAAGETVAVVGAVLRGCGVEPERMVDAIRAVRAGLHGFVALEISGGFGLPSDIDASFAFLVRTLEIGIRGAPDGAHPRPQAAGAPRQGPRAEPGRRTGSGA